MIQPGYRIVCGLLAATLVTFIFARAQSPLAGGGIPAPWDKLAHAGAYGTIAGLSLLAALLRGRWWIFAGTVAIGLADELNQLRFANRSADPLDLAADVCGAFLAVTLYRALIRSRLGVYGRPVNQF